MVQDVLQNSTEWSFHSKFPLGRSVTDGREGYHVASFPFHVQHLTRVGCLIKLSPRSFLVIWHRAR